MPDKHLCSCASWPLLRKGDSFPYSVKSWHSDTFNYIIRKLFCKMVNRNGNLVKFHISYQLVPCIIQLYTPKCVQKISFFLLFFRQFPILLKISISHLYICIFANGYAQSQWGIFSQIFCCNFSNLILRGHLKCYHVTNNFFSDDHIEIAYHWSRRLI